MAAFHKRKAAGDDMDVSSDEEEVTTEDPLGCFGVACGNAGQHVCGSCKQAKYCSAECQKAHWKVHKEHCKQIVARAQYVQAF